MAKRASGSASVTANLRQLYEAEGMFDLSEEEKMRELSRCKYRVALLQKSILKSSTHRPDGHAYALLSCRVYDGVSESESEESEGLQKHGGAQQQKRQKTQRMPTTQGPADAAPADAAPADAGTLDEEELLADPIEESSQSPVEECEETQVVD